MRNKRLVFLPIAAGAILAMASCSQAKTNFSTMTLGKYPQTLETDENKNIELLDSITVKGNYKDNYKLDESSVVGEVTSEKLKDLSYEIDLTTDWVKFNSTMYYLDTTDSAGNQYRGVYFKTDKERNSSQTANGYTKTESNDVAYTLSKTTDIRVQEGKHYYLYKDGKYEKQELSVGTKISEIDNSQLKRFETRKDDDGNIIMEDGKPKQFAIEGVPDIVDYLSFTRTVNFNVYWFKVEDVKWDVIATEGSEKVLMSDKILEAQAYADYDNTYETSSIRSWLNGSFYNTVFSANDKTQVIQTLVKNSLDAANANDTNDYVYLLSESEALNLLKNPVDRQAEVTDYALCCGAFCASVTTKSGYSWLRTPDTADGTAKRINYNGDISGNYTVSSVKMGVRPVIRVAA